MKRAITPKIQKAETVIKAVDPKLRVKKIKPPGTKFRVNSKSVKTAVQGLITFTTENPKLKNRLFEDEQFPLFLQINSVKIPTGHSKIVRISLKHSTLTPDSDVCLIVPDVKGIANKNHDEHLVHYEELLRRKGVENIKKIMTFHEFRTEYETFELKRRLVELYDAFLVDGRISGKTVKKCGKIFYKKRKVPTSIKLQVTKLKEHIEQALCKTLLHLHPNGDSFTVQIGHSKMELADLAENVFSVLEGLEKDFPGGFENVRSINMYSYRGISIPIYTTLKNQNEVVLPQVKKQKIIDTVSGDLSTRLHSKARVTPKGKVIVKRIKRKIKEKE
ncbi:ribosomal L1 domain-containing protein 1-like [Tenebrio molitor]|uniref:ribosomal L1 domain-containing protein 1-like n=1 Tax=Tenebrio molitor TaxID=7067 RepID=UPI0036247E4B